MTVEIMRTDKSACDLRCAAAACRDAKAARRMLAIALILDGTDRKTAAENCGMDRQDGRGRCPCLAHPRRCRLARISKTGSAGQHHPAQTPALFAGTQSDGKRLGLPARQQAGNLCV